MMREWPEPKTWTIRPARIVWANQSAAVRIWFCCSETQSMSSRQRARYSAEGEFKVEVWIFRSSKFKVQSSKSRKKQGRKEKISMVFGTRTQQGAVGGADSAGML